MAQEYKIKTVMDFAALDPGQRKRCVADLLNWAELMDVVKEVKALGIHCEEDDFMSWVDDGKTDASLIITDLDGAVLATGKRQGK